MKIKIDHVTKNIKGACVLDDVSMELESGNIYGFEGKNGSGKTMLLRAISGLIYATEGSIQVDGKTLGKDISFPPSMGLLIENPAFLAGYSGYDNLKMIASIKKQDVAVGDAIRRVGLDPKDRRKYRKYSLGMKQRLGIACAIMEKPGLLILDEPFNALDRSGQQEIANIILEMKEDGCLVLVTSHDEQELERLSDHIFAVENGKFAPKGE